MDQYKKGRSSFQPPVSPVLTAWSSVAGKKESEGPLGACFDKTDPDAYWGEKTYEQAESRMQKDALEILLRKGGLSETDIGLVFSGDLLNQCVGSRTRGSRPWGFTEPAPPWPRACCWP